MWLVESVEKREFHSRQIERMAWTRLDNHEQVDHRSHLQSQHQRLIRMPCHLVQKCDLTPSVGKLSMSHDGKKR